MQITIYSYNYYPEPIGIAPLMTELAEGLVRRGHKVRVVTAMPNYPERQIYPGYRGKLYLTELRNGVAIQRSYVWIRPKPGLIDRLLLDASFVVTSFIHALRGDRPDVVLLTAPPLPVAVPAALLAWVHQCPVVLNLQDILPEAAIYVGLLSNKYLIRIFEGLEKFAYRTATKIAVIADSFINNLLKKGIPAEKIELIPNWVDIDFIRPLPKIRNSFRVAHHLEDKFLVLYSGNIGLTQGLETVIETATLLQQYPEIAIAIVGEEKAIEKLRERCQKTHVDNVVLLPFEPRARLPEMLAAADIGLVVQKHNVISFNMPSKIQVILASGRPIVASVPSTGTAAWAVQQSGGGIVVPPEDPKALAAAIVELYLDPDRLDALGKQGREHAIAHYSFEQALNRYEELFMAVTEKA